MHHSAIEPLSNGSIISIRCCNRHSGVTHIAHSHISTIGRLTAFLIAELFSNWSPNTLEHWKNCLKFGALSFIQLILPSGPCRSEQADCVWDIAHFVNLSIFCSILAFHMSEHDERAGTIFHGQTDSIEITFCWDLRPLLFADPWISTQGRTEWIHHALNLKKEWPFWPIQRISNLPHVQP